MTNCVLEINVIKKAIPVSSLKRDGVRKSLQKITELSRLGECQRMPLKDLMDVERSRYGELVANSLRPSFPPRLSG